MNFNCFDLKDKITLITGTSRGIGKALARGFIEAGALVHGMARKESTISKEENYTHHIIDLSNKESIINLVKEIGSTRQRINVLINCAGESLQIQNKEIIDDSIKAVLDINLLSPYYLCNSVAQYEKIWLIINVTSI